MYYRYYNPHPYYRRYYNPYNYRRYYNPFYNIVDSQVSDINQSINNFGDMTDVIQDADVYQSMTPEYEEPKVVLEYVPREAMTEGLDNTPLV
jgi:hypothetical protein